MHGACRFSRHAKQGGLRALFLTWDGADQTYLESLFFPIFARLRGLGIDVHVLQFTWAAAEELRRTREAAAELGIAYLSHATSRGLGGLSQAAAIARGAGLVARYAREQDIQLLFPRSLLPAAMSLLAAKLLSGARIVFDADGLMADERVDFAGWSPHRPQYRTLREVEARALRAASAVITRTRAAKTILATRAGVFCDARKIFVIPNAKDDSVFRPGTAETRQSVRERLGVPRQAPWLVYTGSIGPQYLPDKLLAVFAALRRRSAEARLLLLTFQVEHMRELLRSQGLSPDGITIQRATPSEIPALLAAADLGLSLRKQSFSQRAICPIKVAEYLQCGLPVLASRVGDLAEQLADRRVAYLLDDESDAALQSAADWLLDVVMPEREELRERCRQLGVSTFGLDSCARAYQAAFERAAGAGEEEGDSGRRIQAW